MGTSSGTTCSWPGCDQPPSWGQIESGVWKRLCAVHLHTDLELLHLKSDPTASEASSSFEVSSVGGSRSMSMADELAKLADLRDRGVLTDSEFENEKQALLADRPGPVKPSPPAEPAIKAPFEVRSVDAPTESDRDDSPPENPTPPSRGFGDPKKRELQLKADRGNLCLMLGLVLLAGGLLFGFTYGSEWCGKAFTPSRVAGNPLSGCEGLVAVRVWSIAACAAGGVLLLVGAAMKKSGTEQS